MHQIPKRPRRTTIIVFKIAISVFVFLLLTPSLAYTAGFTIGSGCYLALNDGSLDVDGDVGVTGTLTVGSGSINLTGNWSNSGTFTAGTGTVTFNGTDQTISGATTFYNLTKTVTSAATLTFQNGSANKTTITNTLTLQGADGQLLSLRSNTAGSQWEIDPQGTRTIGYLDVKDSNNVAAANINAVDNNCTDSGNNTKWSFSSLTSGTFYVDIANGDDANDGSAAHPWKTLHYAIDRINGGTTGTYILIMAAGTYNLGNGETDTAITLSQSNVTIIGEGDAAIGASNPTAVFDGSGAGTWTTCITVASANATIKNLSIENFSYGIHISGGSGNEVLDCKLHNNTRGIEISSSSDCNVKNCEIYNNTDGLYIYSSTGEMYYNIIRDNTGMGIAAYNCSPQIKRNKIYDNNTGIRVEAGSSNTTSPAIENNSIYETISGRMDSGIVVYGSGGTVNPTIYHNSIDGGSGDGIAVVLYQNPPPAPVIKYNVITRCDRYGIDVTPCVTCTIDYNDVWQNGGGNYEGVTSGCNASANDISEDPKNGQAGPLASDSPCIDTIPTNLDPADPVTIDYLGYKRPKGSGFDMGAYEYVATQSDPKILPGGAGVETDYRIFTIPLDIGTGLDMRNIMEGTLGSYDPFHWRVFARTASGDIEMNTQAFESLDIKPGMGFWLITLYTNTINFQGTLSPDGIYYKMELAPGWRLFAIPWPSTNINLGKIYVSDGVNQYPITDASNTLTEKYIWDYTGTGSTGYTVRSTTDFPLAAGTGYFIKVLGTKNIILSIPPNNVSDPPNSNSVSSLPAMSYGFPESVSFPDDLEPPPLPGDSYGPVPDIKANGKSGPVIVSKETPVSITVSLDPGDQVDENADWWIVAHTPFAWPLDWYSYVYPEGWRPGIYPCVQTPLFQVPPSFEVLNMVLPTGDYKFYFAVDENADGILDETWLDSVNIRVE